MRNLHQVLTPWVQGPRLGVDWLEEHISEVSPRSAAVVPRTAQPGPPVLPGQGKALSDLGNPSREASPGPRAASFPPRSTRVHSLTFPQTASQGPLCTQGTETPFHIK